MSGAAGMSRQCRANRFTIGEVRAFWDSVADEYVHEDGALAETHFQRFERVFARFEPRDGMRALNVWSRTGEAIEYFRRFAPRMELVNAEVSARMIRKARARWPGETFVHTDLYPLPFADEEFDFILSLETLEHAPDPLAFLEEVARVLKPGGRLVLSCPPATAELPLKIYETFLPNHGEGPHRFPSSREVKGLLHVAGLELKSHESTLFIPVGPRFLRRFDPVVERVVAQTPLRELGIRQFYMCERPRGAGPWQELMRRVVENDLCTRCGTCVGACPSRVLEFAAIEGACLPFVFRPEACTRCGSCVAACPGARVSFADVHASAGDSPIKSGELGPIRRIRVARARDSGVRLAGASGGAVTAILCDLLKRREITGAVVLDQHPDAPWRPWPRVARTEGEIVHAAQSKYCVTPTNVALRDINPGADRVAVVALPCQIHALRSLQRRGHPAMKAVPLIIGLYCGNQLYFGATRSFLRRHGVRDLSEVAFIRYRDGPWPGQVRGVLKDGRALASPKLHFNHLISFYTLERCLLCADLAAEGADISVADAWDAKGATTGGSSLVVSRTDRGESIVSNLVARGVLDAEEIGLDRALAMHTHGLDLKKTGALLRIRALARRGKPVPQYDLPDPSPSATRRLVEVFVSAHFRLCRTRLARWILDRIPFGLLGRVYVGARATWMNVAARKYADQGDAAAVKRRPWTRCWRLLGPLLFFVMLWRIGPQRCWSVVCSADPIWFLLACAMSIPASAMKAIRWQAIVRELGYTLSVRESAGMYAVGMLAGAVTPGKVGDLAKAPLLAARGVPWKFGIACSLFDRVLDGMVLFTLALGGILALPASPGRSVVVTAAAVAIGLTAAAATIFRKALAKMLGSIAVRWWLIMVPTTLGAMATYFASAWFCARALEIQLGLCQVIAGASVAAVLALLPVTVAGIGTRDAAFVVIFAQCGVDAGHAVAMSSLILASMLVNCVLFLAAARLGLRRPPRPIAYPAHTGATLHESAG